MDRVGRYAKATAKPGQGQGLAERLLAVADGLRSVPGCELYVINRAADEPDTVWVTEIWTSREALDASLETDATKAQIPEVLALVAGGGFERIDVVPLGGVGLEEAPPGFTVHNLDRSEDLAAAQGFGEILEARFPTGDLGAGRTGLSIQHYRPGMRQGFAHRHRRAEEIYVVLSGSGRVKIEDEIVDIGPRDAIRVGPDQTRAFEAGPDGLEILAFSARAPGDAEMVRDWWTD
jgi:quinol monooxygenase YgiN/mannose-6-phosphate isomerase-like protein (cupin superfamily)